jgi:hypothetical protein
MELTDLNKIKKEDFEPYLNQQLQIVFSDASIPAELTEIVEMNSFSPLDRQPFSLEFTIGTEFPSFRQGIYRLVFAEQLKIDVFIVPIGPGSKGQRYQIIFS